MLDTDISSYIIKGGYGAVERKLIEVSPLDVCISVITRAELLYGLKPLAANHFLQTDVRDFLAVTTVLDWKRGAADVYADVRHQLKTDGMTIGDGGYADRGSCDCGGCGAGDEQYAALRADSTAVDAGKLDGVTDYNPTLSRSAKDGAPGE